MIYFSVLGLGSNKPYGNQSPVELINAAAGELQKTLSELRLSPLYKTAPLHVTDQSPFINAAIAGFFNYEVSQNEEPISAAVNAAQKMLEIIHGIEGRYGRNRSAERRWGERSLDIDILLFGGMVIAEDDLVIPHPRLKERAFALRPLLDLLPDAREPETGIRYSDVLAALPEQGIENINNH